MDELNEGALPKSGRSEALKQAQVRYVNSHRDRYNEYHAEYYRNNKERINARRRELYRAKHGGNDGVQDR